MLIFWQICLSRWNKDEDEEEEEEEEEECFHRQMKGLESSSDKGTNLKFVYKL